MKYQKVLLCLALTGTLLFTGCGAANNSKENTTVSAELSTETDTTNDKASTESAEGTTVTGMVSSVSDTELTIASMPENARAKNRMNHRPMVIPMVLLTVLPISRVSHRQAAMVPAIRLAEHRI